MMGKDLLDALRSNGVSMSIATLYEKLRNDGYLIYTERVLKGRKQRFNYTNHNDIKMRHDFRGIEYPDFGVAVSNEIISRYSNCLKGRQESVTDMESLYDIVRKVCDGASVDEYLRRKLVFARKNFKRFYNCKMHVYYLNSRKWKEKRELVLNHYGRKCFRCSKEGVEGLDVHHLTYKNWLDENLEELIPLCRDCHDYIHLSFTDPSLSPFNSHFANDLIKIKKTIQQDYLYGVIDRKEEDKINTDINLDEILNGI